MVLGMRLSHFFRNYPISAVPACRATSRTTRRSSTIPKNFVQALGRIIAGAAVLRGGKKKSIRPRRENCS